jgi:hypothetical protein
LQYRFNRCYLSAAAATPPLPEALIRDALRLIADKET